MYQWCKFPKNRRGWVKHFNFVLLLFEITHFYQLLFIKQLRKNNCGSISQCTTHTQTAMQNVISTFVAGGWVFTWQFCTKLEKLLLSVEALGTRWKSLSLSPELGAIAYSQGSRLKKVADQCFPIQRDSPTALLLILPRLVVLCFVFILCLFCVSLVYICIGYWLMLECSFTNSVLEDCVT